MSLALWMLLSFACWTLLVLLAGVGVRRWALIFSGRAKLTSFPADTPHGSPAYRRAMRAHANSVENLPVFATIVLVAAAAHLNPSQLGLLAAAAMAARIMQTSVHVLMPETIASIAVRFAFFFAQLVAMIAMAILVITAAIATGAVPASA
jgi:uncharacterized MAPEG superfamily protein